MAVSWETTSDFFEASFRMIFCCYDACDRFRASFHVVLDVDAVKLQIPILQKTPFPTANDHSLCVSSQVLQGNDASKHHCFTKAITFVSTGKLI